MAVNIVFGGQVYSIPSVAGERNWASLTDYLLALSNNALTSETFIQNIREVGGSEVTGFTTDSVIIIDSVAPVTITLPASVQEGKIYSIYDTAGVYRDITLTNTGDTFPSINNAIQVAFKDGAYQIISNISEIDAQIVIQVAALQDTVDSIVDADADNKFAIYMRNAAGELVSTYQTSAIKLPTGTTAQRPTGQQGLFRYNSETNDVEVYNGTEWKQLTTTDIAGASLDDLSDVIITTPEAGESLVYNGTEWVNEAVAPPPPSATTLEDLTDTVITTPQVGEALVYNGTEWINEELVAPTPTLTLDDLTDTDIINPQVGESLVYNGTEWFNADMPSPSSTAEIVNVTATSAVNPTGDTRYLCNGAQDIDLNISTGSLPEGSYIIVQNNGSNGVSVGGVTLRGSPAYVHFLYTNGAFRIHVIKNDFEEYLAVAQSGANSVIAYGKDIDSFEKLPDLDGLLSSALGIAFSPDGLYLATVYFPTPALTIHKRSGNTFTKLANPSVTPVGTSRGVAFNANSQYMAVATDSFPFLLIYRRNGDDFTNVIPDIEPAGGGQGVAFSADSVYLAIAHAVSPFISIYKRDVNDFTKLADPTGGLPVGAGNDVALSPNGTYMAVAHQDSPFVTVYKRSGDSFSRLAYPDIPPTGSARGVSFSPDSEFLVVAHNESPYLTIYKRNGDIFNKLNGPLSLPTGNAADVVFSGDGNYIAVGHNNAPYLTTYKRDGNVFTKLANPNVTPTGTIWGVTFYPPVLGK